MCVRSTQCALHLLHELDGYQGLRLHIGIGAGDCLLLNVGGLVNRWEFVVAGPPLKQMGIAEGAAGGGEVCVSPQVHDLAGRWCHSEPAAGGEAYVVRQVTRPLPPQPTMLHQQRTEAGVRAMRSKAETLRRCRSMSNLLDCLSRHVPTSPAAGAAGAAAMAAMAAATAVEAAAAESVPAAAGAAAAAAAWSPDALVLPPMPSVAAPRGLLPPVMPLLARVALSPGAASVVSCLPAVPSPRLGSPSPLLSSAHASPAYSASGSGADGSGAGGSGAGEAGACESQATPLVSSPAVFAVTSPTAAGAATPPLPHTVPSVTVRVDAPVVAAAVAPTPSPDAGPTLPAALGAGMLGSSVHSASQGAGAAPARREKLDSFRAKRDRLQEMVTLTGGRAEAIAQVERLLAGYVPGGIQQQLRGSLSHAIREMRRASVLFVNLPDEELDWAAPRFARRARRQRRGEEEQGYEDEGSEEEEEEAEEEEAQEEEEEAAAQARIQALLVHTQEVLQCMQSELYRHEGQLRQFLVEDKGTTFIGVFGLYPFAHENDPELAVRCALGIARGLNRMGVRCRIGVTTGMVFAGASAAAFTAALAAGVSLVVRVFVRPSVPACTFVAAHRPRRQRRAL